MKLKGNKDIGDGINKIIANLAEANDLVGIITVADFNDADKLGRGKEMQDRLTTLVGIFQNPALNFSRNRADGDDILGDAYEYLMRNFATQSGKSKGQFYTPAEVSRVISQVIGVNTAQSQEQTIYDPTCGSGSLLLKAADEAKQGLTIYGQEMDNATRALGGNHGLDGLQDDTEGMEGYKRTEVGVIPVDWELKKLGEVSIIHVGRDLKENNFSVHHDSTYKYPVYSNTVDNEGLYGFYNLKEYHGDSLTVVGRGVGLGTAFTRSGSYGAIGRLLVIFPNHELIPFFVAEYINHKVKIFEESSGIPQLTGIQIAKYKIPIPPLSEQKTIARSLSDTDELIAGCDRAIAKKRNIKQGAMQQLLTGKMRLPGFSGEWEVKTFVDICFVNQGLQIAIEKRLKNPQQNSKKYITIQFLNNGKNIEYINDYSSSVVAKMMY